MTRSLLLPLTVLLALATGLGLLAVAATLSQAPVTVASLPIAAADATRQFYVAADLALHTGDTTALEDAVTVDYVDHATPPASPDGMPGYLRFLAEVRAACPDCRLTARDLAVSHDQAAVQVTVQGHRQGTATAVAVDGLPLVWSALDVLRIAGGLVAERWSRGDALALTAAEVSDLPDHLAIGSAELQVARFFLRPGTALPPFATGAPALLVVEAGSVAVRTDGVIGKDVGYDQLLDPIHIDVAMTAGERCALSAELWHRIANEGSDPAVVVVLTTASVTVLPGT